MAGNAPSGVTPGVQYRWKTPVVPVVRHDTQGSLAAFLDSYGPGNYRLDGATLYVITLTGEIKPNLGDYVVRGSGGEFVVFNPAAFAANFEVAPGP